MGVEGHGRGEHAPFFPAERLADVAAGRYEARHAGVGRPGDGTAVFDGAQARDREEVFVAGRVAPPAVVRDDGHELGAAAHEVAEEVAVEPLVADCRAGFHAPVFEGRAVLPHADLSHDAAQVDYQELQDVENDRRGVFHADHQFAFVVQLYAACGVEPTAVLNTS